MNKNILILAAVIVIVLVGVFLLQGQRERPAVTDQQLVPGEEQQEPAPLPPQTFTVEGTDFAFSPSEITVNSGAPVRITFVNAGNVAHNFVIPQLGVGTNTIGPGQQETMQFSVGEPGTYSLETLCSVPGHKEAGMVGTLIVQ